MIATQIPIPILEEPEPISVKEFVADLEPVIIAFKDEDPDMTPVSKEGVLVIYTNFADAANDAGPLGVAVCVSKNSALQTCKSHGIKFPEIIWHEYQIEDIQDEQIPEDKDGI